MKSKVVLVGGVAVISFGLLTCSPGASQTPVEVSCDQFRANNSISKEVDVNVGDPFTVILCSNASTGYEWAETAEISDGTVVEQTNHEVVPPEAEGDKPVVAGAPGQQKWTFKPLKTGTSTISMEYSRPWEGGEKGAWTFELTVTVK